MGGKKGVLTTFPPNHNEKTVTSFLDGIHYGTKPPAPFSPQVDKEETKALSLPIEYDWLALANQVIR